MSLPPRVEKGSSRSRSADMQAKRLRTRAPLELPEDCLPSVGDVFRHALYRRSESGCDTMAGSGSYPDKDLARDVATDVCRLYSETVIQFVPPIVSNVKTVAEKILRLLKKSKVTTHHLSGSEASIDAFLNNSNELFDILACKDGTFGSKK